MNTTGAPAPPLHDDIGRRILSKHLSRRWQLVVAVFVAVTGMTIFGILPPETWSMVVLTELAMYGAMDFGDRFLLRREP